MIPMGHNHINKGRIRVLLKNGYNEIDIRSQTIIKPDGTTEMIPQFEVDHYLNLNRFQRFRGV